MKAIFNYSGSAFLETYEAHSGQEVEVVRELADGMDGFNAYHIRADDGWEADVFDYELTFIEEGAK